MKERALRHGLLAPKAEMSDDDEVVLKEKI
jgi:hypothetical protein